MTEPIECKLKPYLLHLGVASDNGAEWITSLRYLYEGKQHTHPTKYYLENIEIHKFLQAKISRAMARLPSYFSRAGVSKRNEYLEVYILEKSVNGNNTILRLVTAMGVFTLGKSVNVNDAVLRLVNSEDVFTVRILVNGNDADLCPVCRLYLSGESLSL